MSEQQLLIGSMEGVTQDPPAEEVPNPEPLVSPVDQVESQTTKPNPEDELWPGGPKFAEIDKWKEAHGDVYVTSITPDTHYVWRTLTRFEYRRLVKGLEQSVSTGQVTQAEANMNNEEAIAEAVVLFPQVTRTDMAGQLAGLASIIAQECLEASGFNAIEVRQL